MLFRSLDTYLNASLQPRILPHLNNYIETLNTRREIIADRYLNTAGYESKFVVLLRKILFNADIQNLLKKNTDVDAYFDILISTSKDLDAIFDSVQTGLSFTNVAIAKHNSPTEEFFIPVQCVDPVTSLPFDKGWDAWKQIKPVRLVDIDSLELTFNLYQDQIVFKKYFPTRAILTIDTTALVLQYLNFLKADDTGISQPQYLHRYVIVHILEDLENLWLCNFYNKLITHPKIETEDSININDLMGDRFYGYVGVELPTAIKEIVSFIKLVKSGVITPAVFIKSLRISDSDVLSYLKSLLLNTFIEDIRQYGWMEYLRDIRWLNLFYDSFILQPDFVGTKNLLTALRRDLPILNMTKFWQNARDTNIKNVIRNDMQDWINKIK